MALQQHTGKTIYASGLRELALFAGAGGGILGGLLLGWRTVCAVELNSFCARRLMQRQNEGHLPPFPIWDDVRTFRGREWRGIVDVVSGGFPCQDISISNLNGEGITGEQSRLWFEYARVIDEVRPLYAFVENSPMLITKGLHRVLGSLAELGYNAEWGLFSAAQVGASHQRNRIWILAWDAALRRQPRCQRPLESEVAKSGEPFPLVDARNLQARHPNRKRLQRRWPTISQSWMETLHAGKVQPFPKRADDLPQPRLYRSGNGLADLVDRTKAVGNGQVPAVAATAWSLLYQRTLGREEETC